MTKDRIVGYSLKVTQGILRLVYKVCDQADDRSNKLLWCPLKHLQNLVHFPLLFILQTFLKWIWQIKLHRMILLFDFLHTSMLYIYNKKQWINFSLKSREHSSRILKFRLYFTDICKLYETMIKVRQSKKHITLPD